MQQTRVNCYMCGPAGNDACPGSRLTGMDLTRFGSTDIGIHPAASVVSVSNIRCRSRVLSVSILRLLWV